MPDVENDDLPRQARDSSASTRKSFANTDAHRRMRVQGRPMTPRRRKSRWTPCHRSSTCSGRSATRHASEIQTEWSPHSERSFERRNGYASCEVSAAFTLTFLGGAGTPLWDLRTSRPRGPCVNSVYYAWVLCNAYYAMCMPYNTHVTHMRIINSNAYMPCHIYYIYYIYLTIYTIYLYT